jgi:hypothetical protein
MSNAIEKTPAPLQPADKCDRCNARAYVRAVLPGGSELLFCAHHARQHASALQEAAATLQDPNGVLASLNQSVN